MQFYWCPNNCLSRKLHMYQKKGAFYKKKTQFNYIKFGLVVHFNILIVLLIMILFVSVQTRFMSIIWNKNFSSQNLKTLLFVKPICSIVGS